eukprot:4775973-Prymnesium_polylepis.1
MRPLRQRSGNSQSSAERLRLAEALSQFCALSEFLAINSQPNRKEDGFFRVQSEKRPRKLETVKEDGPTQAMACVAPVGEVHLNAAE